MTTKTAAQLEAGDVIVKTGRTLHRPITVTATRVLDLYSGDLIVVTGFTGSNPVPRLMFRGLAADLAVTVTA